MAKRRNYRPLIVLVVLAAVAFVAATVTFTNVTYWLINATRPPAMKYAGADTAIAGGQYVRVSFYYDSGRGINITRISIVGFTGDPTTYDSVVRVCNYYGNIPIQARLEWRGRVTNTGHEQYIKAFYVRGPDGQRVGFEGGTTYTTAGPYTINPGQCITLGAYVAIDPAIPPHLANGRTVLGQYQIDIIMSAS
jgi:hypothetical protein